MGFFDNLSDKISTGGAKVAEKAKDVTEIATLTATVEKEKVVLEKLYNEVGKKFFENYKEELRAKFPEEVGKMEASLKKIEDSKNAIKDKKGVAVCPACGKEVPKNAKFCPACGAKMPEVEVKEEAKEETQETNE